MALIMLQKPVAGEVRSKFGMRMHPVLHTKRMHAGIDLKAGTGTQVHAAAPGKVNYSGLRGEAGLAVMIDHGGGVETLYAHNSKLLVKVGQQVNRGDVVSLSGNTGLSTGPHVHFGVRVNGKYVDPEAALSAGISTTGSGPGPAPVTPVVNSYAVTGNVLSYVALAAILVVVKALKDRGD